MKILILTQNHPYKNNGTVALDLYNQLKELEGNKVKMIVSAWDKYPDKNIIPIDTKYPKFLVGILRIPIRLFNKLGKIFFGYKVRNEPKGYTHPFNNVKTHPEYCVQGIDQTITTVKTKYILRKAGFKPDTIIVFFKPPFVSFKNLYELFKLTGADIYLYLMDMAPITGGCHYAWNCDGYTKECGNCPALYSNDQNDQTNANYRYKKMYIEKSNIFPIAATEWQFKQLNRSSLFKNTKKGKVLLSIDENKYCPSDKIKARQELGLPIEKKIIFFGAFYVDDKRKGFRELAEALNILSREILDQSMIHLSIAGYNNDNSNDLLPFSYTTLGYLEVNDLPKAFQAADFFVCPSVEDSGPMMVNQSIMCGTPVVSFEMGVALDLVITGETGYRAKLKDAEDLARGIQYLLQLGEQEYLKVSKNCRDLGLKLCHPTIQAATFMQLFEGNK
jgi:glycosyltransferase involved in cell wall biosynthesis